MSAKLSAVPAAWSSYFHLLVEHQKSLVSSRKQLKLGMNPHPINIYGAAISIETRVGDMLIIGGHPQRDLID